MTRSSRSTNHSWTNRLMEREIASVRPDWPGPMQHLILGLLSTYRCRLSDFFLHEQVMLLHVILGRGEQLFRAHDRSLFFWHHTNGCWLRSEGARVCFRGGVFVDAGRSVPFIANECCESGRRAATNWDLAKRRCTDVASFSNGQSRQQNLLMIDTAWAGPEPDERG